MKHMGGKCRHNYFEILFLVTINRCLGASSGSLTAFAAVANLDTEWLNVKFRSTIRRVEKLRFGAFNSEFEVATILKVIKYSKEYN